MTTGMNRESIIKDARRMLLGNLRTGKRECDSKEFFFVCPSNQDYPFQWFWDSCLHAIALIHIDVDMAKKELITLLSTAHPSGFIPHITFWESEKREEFLKHSLVAMDNLAYSSTIQPPLIAYAVERVFEATNDKRFLADALPILVGFYRWLRDFRDPDKDGLISIIQPEESGIDCSPKFDDQMGMSGTLDNKTFIRQLKKLYDAYAPLRGDERSLLDSNLFHFEDVLVNSIYVQGLRSLIRMLGDSPLVDEFVRDARKCTDALIGKCWDEEMETFFDLSGVEENPVKIVTVSCLMPLIIEDLPEDIVRKTVERYLLSPEHFWLKYPIPSVSVSEEKFFSGDPHGFIWRGPTWLNINWFLSRGLRSHGYHEIADRIASTSYKLVERAGFREYYNPHTGAGYGARDFGWSSIILDM